MRRRARARYEGPRQGRRAPPEESAADALAAARQQEGCNGFAVGIKTTVTVASAVTGIAPGLRNKLRVRAEAPKFLRPFGEGRSASLVLAIHKGPIADDCLAHALRYHQEAWEARNDPLVAASAGRMPLSTLHAAWKKGGRGAASGLAPGQGSPRGRLVGDA